MCHQYSLVGPWLAGPQNATRDLSSREGCITNILLATLEENSFIGRLIVTLDLNLLAAPRIVEISEVGCSNL